MIVPDIKEAMQICPIFTLGQLANSAAFQPKPMVCEGSRCAFWRWWDRPIDSTPQPRRVYANENPTAYQQPEGHHLADEGWTFVPFQPVNKDGEPARFAHWIEPEEPRLEVRRGYCGVARRPREPL